MMNLFSIFIVANIELCVEMIFQELVAYESNFIKKKKWQWKSNLIEAGSSIELLPFFFHFYLFFFFAICIGISNFFLCNLPFFVFFFIFFIIIFFYTTRFVFWSITFHTFHWNVKNSPFLCHGEKSPPSWNCELIIIIIINIDSTVEKSKEL